MQTKSNYILEKKSDILSEKAISKLTMSQRLQESLAALVSATDQKPREVSQKVKEILSQQQKTGAMLPGAMQQAMKRAHMTY